jgi:hypothetical protein
MAFFLPQPYEFSAFFLSYMPKLPHILSKQHPNDILNLQVQAFAALWYQIVALKPLLLFQPSPNLK